MPFTPETEIEFGSLHDKKIIGSPHRPVRNRCNFRGGLDLSVRAHRFRSFRCAALTVSETQNEAKDNNTIQKQYNTKFIYIVGDTNSITLAMNSYLPT